MREARLESRNQARSVCQGILTATLRTPSRAQCAPRHTMTRPQRSSTMGNVWLTSIRVRPSLDSLLDAHERFRCRRLIPHRQDLLHQQDIRLDANGHDEWQPQEHPPGVGLDLGVRESRDRAEVHNVVERPVDSWPAPAQGGAVQGRTWCPDPAAAPPGRPQEGRPWPLMPGGPVRSGCAHWSTPPLSSCTPLAKCGISLLSTMLSAAAIAACMSRYL